MKGLFLHERHTPIHDERHTVMMIIKWYTVDTVSTEGLSDTTDE